MKKILSILNSVVIMLSLFPSSVIVKAEDNVNMLLDANWDNVEAFEYSEDYSSDWDHNYLKQKNTFIKSSIIDGNQCVRFSTVGKTASPSSGEMMTGGTLLTTDNALKLNRNLISECDFYLPESLTTEATEGVPYNIGMSPGYTWAAEYAIANMAVYGDNVSTDTICIKPTSAGSDNTKLIYSNTDVRKISTNEWHNVKFVIEFDTMYTSPNGATIKVYLDNEYFFTCTPIETSSFSVFKEKEQMYMEKISLKGWTKSLSVSAVYFDNAKYYQSEGELCLVNTEYDTEKMQLNVTMNNIVDYLGEVKITESADESVELSHSCIYSDKTAMVEISDLNFKLNTDYILTANGVKDIYGNLLSEPISYQFNSGAGNEFLQIGDGILNEDSKTVTFSFTNILALEQNPQITVCDSNDNILQTEVSYNGKRLVITIPNLVSAESYKLEVSDLYDIYGNVILTNSSIEFNTKSEENNMVEINWDNVDPFDYTNDENFTHNSNDGRNNLRFINTKVTSGEINNNQCAKLSTVGVGGDSNLTFSAGWNILVSPLADPEHGVLRLENNYIEECDFYLPSSLGAEVSKSSPLNIAMTAQGNTTASGIANMAIYGDGINASDTLSIKPDLGGVNENYLSYSTTEAKQITANEWHNIKFVAPFETMYSRPEGTPVKVYLDNEYFFTCTPLGTSRSNYSPFADGEQEYVERIAIKTWTKNKNISAVYFDNVKYYQKAIKSTFGDAEADGEKIVIEASDLIYSVGEASITDTKNNSIEASVEADGKRIVITSDELVTGKVYNISLNNVQNIYGNKSKTEQSVRFGAAPAFEGVDNEYISGAAAYAKIEFTNEIDSWEGIEVADSHNGNVAIDRIEKSGKNLLIYFENPLTENATYSVSIESLNDIYDQPQDFSFDLLTYPKFKADMGYNTKENVITIVFSNKLSTKGEIKITDAANNVIEPKSVNYDTTADNHDRATVAFENRLPSDADITVKADGFKDIHNNGIVKNTYTFKTPLALDITKWTYYDKAISFELSNPVETKGTIELYDKYDVKVNTKTDWSSEKNGVVTISDAIENDSEYTAVFTGFKDIHNQDIVDNHRNYSFMMPAEFTAAASVVLSPDNTVAIFTINFSNNIAENQNDLIKACNAYGSDVAGQISINDNIVTYSIEGVEYSNQYTLTIDKNICDIYGQKLKADCVKTFESPKQFSKITLNQDFEAIAIDTLKAGVSNNNWFSNAVFSKGFGHELTEDPAGNGGKAIKLCTAGGNSFSTGYATFHNSSQTLKTAGISNSSNYIIEGDVYFPSTILDEIPSINAPLTIGLTYQDNNNLYIKCGFNAYKSPTTDAILLSSAGYAKNAIYSWKLDSAQRLVSTDEWHNVRFVINMPSIFYSGEKNTATEIELFIDNEFFGKYTYNTENCKINSDTSVSNVGIKVATENPNISAFYLDNLKSYQEGKDFKLEKTEFDESTNTQSLTFNNCIYGYDSISTSLTADCEMKSNVLMIKAASENEFETEIKGLSDIYGNRIDLSLRNRGMLLDDTASSCVDVTDTGLSASLNIKSLDESTQSVLYAVAAYSEFGKLVGITYGNANVTEAEINQPVSVSVSEKPAYVKAFLWSDNDGQIGEMIGGEACIYGFDTTQGDERKADKLTVVVTDLSKGTLLVYGKTGPNSNVEVVVLEGENQAISQAASKTAAITGTLSDDEGYYWASFELPKESAKYTVYEISSAGKSSAVFDFYTLSDAAGIIKGIAAGAIPEAQIYDNVSKLSSYLGADMSCVKTDRDKNLIAKRCIDGKSFLAGPTDEKYYNQIRTILLNALEEIKVLQELEGLTSAYLFEGVFNKIASIQNDGGISLTEYNSLGGLKIKVGEAFLARSEQLASTDELVAFLNSSVTLAKSSNDNGNGNGNNGGNAGGSYSSPNIPKAPSSTAFAAANSKVDDSLFGDLTDYGWAKASIKKLVDLGIVNGVADREFAPALNVTREQFVKMLVLACDSYFENAQCKFSDVDGKAWYASYVASANASGIVNGIGNDIFGVGLSISRQDMAVMVYNALCTAGYQFTSSKTDFTDFESISEYAQAAVGALAFEGIINGMDNGEFLPQQTATRAQAAVIINNMYNKRSSI